MATKFVTSPPLLSSLPVDNPEDLHTLLSMARDKSVEGRTALVKALGDLFYDSHSELSAKNAT